MQAHHRKSMEDVKDRYEGLMSSNQAEVTKAMVLMREEQQVHQQTLEVYSLTLWPCCFSVADELMNI